MRLFLLLLACLAFQLKGSAQSVNWATDIAPILYDHCASCHRDGGVGGFSLVGYDHAFNQRESIMDATQARRMPPWKPDPTYRRYAHENFLTDAEIQRIAQWVNDGAPAGDLSQAPQPPMFNDESSVGVPDLVLQTPFYTITATEDEYRCFVIPNGLSQTAFLRGLEAIPGNHEVVHHILIYEDVTGGARQLDNQTPNEVGYVSFGGIGVNNARLVGSWVPGARTALTPPFMGIKLTPGADLVVQMHYPAGVTGMSDQTKLNFFFTPQNQGVREISINPVLNHSPFSLENYPLFIPANQTKTYHAKYTVPVAASVITVAPHMHLIGRNIEAYGVTPQNDTIRLIRINDWDFHWQGGYQFQKVVKVPAQTVLHAYATYDNTFNNPYQPNDPPQLVTQGEATTDEMMLVYFAYTGYQFGDENIILDSTLLSSDLPRELSSNEALEQVKIWPNPANGQTTVTFMLTEQADYRMSIADVTGRIVRFFPRKEKMPAGLQQETLDLADLTPGIYFLEVQTDAGAVVTRKLVVE